MRLDARGYTFGGACCAAHVLAHVLILLPRKACYNSVAPGRHVGPVRAGEGTAPREEAEADQRTHEGHFCHQSQIVIASTSGDARAITCAEAGHGIPACLIFAAQRPLLPLRDRYRQSADWLIARISDSRRGMPSPLDHAEHTELISLPTHTLTRSY